MKQSFFHRLTSAFIICIVLVNMCSTNVFAMEKIRPTLMQWSNFHAEYQVLSNQGGTLKMTGNLQLSQGKYALYNPEKPIILDTNGYEIAVLDGAELMIDANNLTIHSDISNSGMGVFVVSGGTLNLMDCNIKTTNRTAISLMGSTSSLVMDHAKQVDITVNYTLSNEELFTEYRSGIGSHWADPNTTVLLENTNLVVRGGDAAIHSSANVVLENSHIAVIGDASAKAMQLEHESLTWKQDANSTVLTNQILEVPEVPEPPEQEKSILHGIAEEVETLQFYVSGMPRNSIKLPEEMDVYHATKADENYQTLVDVPVHWDISAVPEVLTEGAYQIQGEFDSQTLLDNGVVNSNHIKLRIQLNVLNPTPLTDLTAGISYHGGQRFVEFKNLPLLTGATAIFGEYSLDGELWNRANGDNLLEDLWFNPEHGGRIVVRYDTPKSFYARLVIVGSSYEGASNAIKFGTADIPDEDTDDSGGDKGGGGQGEHDRPNKPIVPDKPITSTKPEEPIIPNEPDNSIKSEQPSEEQAVPDRQKPDYKPTASIKPLPDRPTPEENENTSTSEDLATVLVSTDKTEVTAPLTSLEDSAEPEETVTSEAEPQKRRDIPAYILAVFVTALLVAVGFVFGNKIKKHHT